MGNMVSRTKGILETWQRGCSVGDSAETRVFNKPAADEDNGRWRGWERPRFQSMGSWEEGG